MVYKLCKNLLVLYVLTLSFTVEAGFLIEPFLGYISGSGEAGSTISVDYDYSTPTYGAKLGYSMLGLSLGADYSMAPEFDLEAKTGSITVKDKHEMTKLGGFIGYDLPAMFRVSANYFADVTLEDTDGSDVGDELSGSGYGLALGYTGLPFVSINVHYNMYTLDESKDASDGTTSSLGANEIDINEIMLSLSLPIDL